MLRDVYPRSVIGDLYYLLISLNIVCYRNSDIVALRSECAEVQTGSQLHYPHILEYVFLRVRDMCEHLIVHYVLWVYCIPYIPLFEQFSP